MTTDPGRGADLERQERYDEKLVQILESACEIFARKGYHNASVRDVAAATGVSAAGLYYYFKSKEELLFLILQHTLGSLMGGIRSVARETEDPAGLLRAIVRTHLAYFEHNRDEMRVLVHEWESLTGPFGHQIRRRMREYASLVIRTFRRLSPERNARELRAAAFGLFGMLTWVDQWHQPERDLPMENLADEFSDIFLRGFLERKPVPLEEDVGEEESLIRQTIRLSPAFAILSGPGF